MLAIGEVIVHASDILVRVAAAARRRNEIGFPAIWTDQAPRGNAGVGRICNQLAQKVCRSGVDVGLTRNWINTSRGSGDAQVIAGDGNPLISG